MATLETILVEHWKMFEKLNNPTTSLIHQTSLCLSACPQLLQNWFDFYSKSTEYIYPILETHTGTRNSLDQLLRYL